MFVTNCITGPLLIPADGSTLSVTDSIVDSVSDGLGRSVALLAPARVIPVLRSPQPLVPLTLTPDATELQLALGTDPIRTVTLAAAPADVPAAASALDAALAGTGARSFAVDDRVVIVGDGRPLAVVATPGSGLAEGLGLNGPNARTRAVVGGTADLIAAASGGSFTITDHRGVDHPAVLAAGASTLAGLASAVQSAVRAADPGLADTMAGALDSALVIVPSGTDAVTVTGAAPDLSTAWSLGLVSPRPAIAGDFSGVPGAAVSLVRCTIFGAVRAESIGVVRDSIVTGLVITDRRQVGCAEYSWIEPGSQTARLHQCQPATPSTPPPVFVSRQFGTQGYGRLAAHRSDRGDPRGERRLRDGRDGTARADAARRQLAPRHRGIPPLRPGGGCRRWHLKAGERPITRRGAVASHRTEQRSGLMKADISAYTFRPDRHFAAVVVGQGQVLVDSAINEQEEIARHRLDVSAGDVVGPSGVPKQAGGFQVSGGAGWQGSAVVTGKDLRRRDSLRERSTAGGPVGDVADPASGGHGCSAGPPFAPASGWMSSQPPRTRAQIAAIAAGQ